MRWLLTGEPSEHSPEHFHAGHRFDTPRVRHFCAASKAVGGQDERVVPTDLAKFGNEVAVALKSALGGDLVGVYFVGSVALGGYVPGESDVDVIGVTRSEVADNARQPIVDAVVDITPSCPARGLESTLYRSEVVARAPVGADFELNANGGPRMERTVHLDAAAEPGFWYVLDRAIAHRYGIAIVGPPGRGRVRGHCPLDTA